MCDKLFVSVLGCRFETLNNNFQISNYYAKLLKIGLIGC